MTLLLHPVTRCHIPSSKQILQLAPTQIEYTYFGPLVLFLRFLPNVYCWHMLSKWIYLIHMSIPFSFIHLPCFWQKSRTTESFISPMSWILTFRISGWRVDGEQMGKLMPSWPLRWLHFYPWVEEHIISDMFSMWRWQGFSLILSYLDLFGL